MHAPGAPIDQGTEQSPRDCWADQGWETLMESGASPVLGRATNRHEQTGQTLWLVVDEHTIVR